MTPADVLDAAADLLESDGWIQGEEQTEHGRCVVGALVGSVGEEASLRTFCAAHDLLAVRVGPVPLWNDEPERTADEVIETLRKVAAEARWSE